MKDPSTSIFAYGVISLIISSLYLFGILSMKNQSEYYLSISGIVFAFISFMLGYGLQKSLSPVILTAYFVIVIAEMG